MIPKPNRIKNQKLLDHIRHNGYGRCQICGAIPSQTHHITSVGASGDDYSENIIRLCWACHLSAHNGRYQKGWLRALATKRIKEEGE